MQIEKASAIPPKITPTFTATKTPITAKLESDSNLLWQAVSLAQSLVSQIKEAVNS
jgi:hypothetical protein